STFATLVLSSAQTDDILDIQRVRIPALVEGRLVQPAFRGTMLRSVPCPTIEAVGEINLVPELARDARLTAQLAGAATGAADAAAVERPSPTSWVATFSPRDLLTGQYEFVIRCSVKGAEYEFKLPLKVAAPQEGEVAYDRRGVLWVRGRPLLPRGIYFATREQELVSAKAAGYNFSIIPAQMASSAIMDKAAAIGLQVVVHSRSLEREQHSSWEHITAKYRNHPALLAWHIVPKPDAELTPPFELRGLRDALAEYDPHHPVVTSLVSPSLMADYADVCDLAMIWSDPIPESGVKALALALDEARAALSPKPIWAIIQTVGHHWSWDTRLDPTSDGRPPTPQEHRCMTYLALVHGATGLVNYTYVFEGARRGKAFRLEQDAPALWASTIRTNRQLAWLEPLLVTGQWQPIELSPAADVHVATWTSGGSILVMAVNTVPRTSVAAFRIPSVASALLTDVFTGQKVIGSPTGEFGVELEPYGVAVLLGRLQAQPTSAPAGQ
ncbi:MAG: hypothetical protein H5T86_12660, partial [Armatimonadetes bacterium]|nr:hypothetical protein [Armatimonadota bacterium]